MQVYEFKCFKLSKIVDTCCYALGIQLRVCIDYHWRAPGNSGWPNDMPYCTIHQTTANLVAKADKLSYMSTMFLFIYEVDK